MSTPITRRGTVVLAAAGALLIAALAAAPQADAATIYTCVKKNGAVRIVTKKAKCKRGENKLTWNTAGGTGKNGANGTNGTNGKEGKEGKEGKPGEKGTARGYAAVSNGAEFEGAHPGFSAVTRIETGTYCLVPAAGSGLDQSGLSLGSPAVVSVDFGWSLTANASVELRQRPFGSCPAADFEVYTFTVNFVAKEYEFSNNAGFDILVP